jgi:cyclic pyranopterin phosphate synthase
MTPLIDGCGRRIDHLRLSVTSECNLRCVYCRPAVASRVAASAILSDRQRLELVTWLYDRFGLRQLRLTGGEPLLHRSIESLIAAIRDAAPDLSIAMTTNGCLLSRSAARLRAAGLDRLNISLDTLDAQSYRELTGGDLAEVLSGIDAAHAARFPAPRLNTVVLRGVNDDHLTPLARWALARGMEIRFLEAMPIGPAADFNLARFVPAAEIRRALQQTFTLKPLPRGAGETAVRYYARNCNIAGTIGIIAPISESFCGQCRRIRVTADGRLYPCLLDSRSVDLGSAWPDGRWDTDMAENMLDAAVRVKQPIGLFGQGAAMVTLGG